MNKEELEASNRSKYGDKSNDLIAHNYSNSMRDGDLWCLMNVRRYVERYLREGSSKANNKVDLLKAMDYLERTFEKSREPNAVTKNISAVLPKNRVLQQNLHINIDAYLFERRVSFLCNLKMMLRELIERHCEDNSKEIIE